MSPWQSGCCGQAGRELDPPGPCVDQPQAGREHCPSEWHHVLLSMAGSRVLAATGQVYSVMEPEDPSRAVRIWLRLCGRATV